MATITNYYIAYVKIHKQDILGENLTNTLKNALYLKLKYTDIDPIQFDIEDIVEYTDYFLFKVKFQGYGSLTQLASSSNNNILEYGVLANVNTGAFGTGPISIPLSINPEYGPFPFSLNAGNNLNYFTAASGSYIFGNTPNAKFTFTGAAAISSNVSTSFAVQLYNYNSGEVIFSNSGTIAAGATSSVDIMGIFSSSLKNDEIYLRIYHLGNPATQQLVIRSAYFEMSYYSPQTPSPNVGVSGSGDLLLITTPGLAADNPLYGNYEDIVPNTNFTSIPYNEYYISDEEFRNIISGSGTDSTVKEYNYQLRRSFIPRYLGSRITSDDLNTDNISQSLLIQSSSNIYLNPTSKGTIPASNYDTVVYEFNEGKAAGPEIPTLGRIDISQILNIDTTSSVNIIYPNDSAFGFTIENKLLKDSKLKINQYSTNAYIPNNIKVVTNNITPRSVYMITSYPQDWSNPPSSSTTYTTNFIETGSFYKIQDYKDGDNFNRIGYVKEGTINTDGCIFQVPEWVTGSQAWLTAATTWSNGSNLQKMPRDTYRFNIDSSEPQIILYNNANIVTMDESGSYIPRGTVNRLDISKSIAEDINNGMKWFITLFDYPFLSPVNNSNINKYWAYSKYTGSLDKENFPFESNGAFEIYAITSSFSYETEFLVKSPNRPIITSYGFNGGIGVHGLLFWKSPMSSSTLIVNNTDLIGLGAGNIVPNNPSPVIQNDLNYIVKNFGNKP